MTAGTMDKVYKRQANEMNLYLKRLRAMSKRKSKEGFRE